MRIHLDLGQSETVDPHAIACELLALGDDREDELLFLYAGEPTAFMAGRLADFALQSRHKLHTHLGHPFMGEKKTPLI